jgi:diguanylate cyclase (GGDEF)-like protein/PAS domain S-box-containing protein
VEDLGVAPPAPLDGIDEAVDHATVFAERVPQAAVFVFDSDYTVRFAAGQALAAAGYATADIVGRPLPDVVSPAAWRILAPHYAAALAGEARNFEYDSPGRGRGYEVHVVPVGGPCGTVGAILIAHEAKAPPGAMPVGVTPTPEQLREAVASSPFALCLTDLDGVCLFANPACADLLGLPLPELVGMSSDEVVHPDDRDRVRATFVRTIRDQSAPGQLEYRLLRPDGTVVHVLNSVTALRDCYGHALQLFSQLLDLTGRREAEDELARRLRQQSTVADFGRRAVAGDSDLGQLMDEAVRLVVETLGVDRCGVLELADEGAALVLRTVSPPGAAGRRFPVAGTLAGHALTSGAPAVAADIEDADVPLEIGLRSALCVPIGGESPFGVLGAYCFVPRALSADERHFLTSIANVLGDAVRRHDAEAELRRRATEDAVTGLPNRAMLDQRLEAALHSARTAGTRVGVLFVDIDHFKVVNDSLGHHAGDQLLRAVAQRLCDGVRGTGMVARFGGDEFVIVAEGLGSTDDAVGLAEKVLDSLARPVLAGQVEHFIGASVGVCLTDPSAATVADDLLRDADTAMYLAKQRGRGRYALLDAESREKAHARLHTEQELRRAVKEGELRLVFQPLARLADGSWFGAETLLRWEHPTRGLLTPDAFLDVAEQSGLIVPIGEWTLREACRHGARWAAAGGDGFLLTVNVSPRQLGDPGIVDAVRRSLDESGLRPDQLGLEITEQALIEVEHEAERALAGLRELGVKLLLDDFGMGYSSLSHLKRFPIAGIKIDRSFIAGLGGDDSDDVAIVRAILAMAWATGKFVIPEGVETPEQASRLRRFGCRLGQGYLFATPVAPDEIDEGLRDAPPTVGLGGGVPSAVPFDPSRFAETAIRVLGALELQLPGSALWIGQLDDEMRVLRVVAASGERSFGLRAGSETEIEASFCHVMVSRGGPQLCGDVRSSTYAGLSLPESPGVGSFVGRPLTVDGAVVGTLCAVAHGSNVYSEADRHLLELGAGILARSLEEVVRGGGDVHEHLRRVPVSSTR